MVRTGSALAESRIARKMAFPSDMISFPVLEFEK
jgi:hypothetical protein